MDSKITRPRDILGEPLPLVRREDWADRLSALIATEQATPFQWGHHDCATLAFAAVREMTGADLGFMLPPWFSAFSAARTMKHAGAPSATEYFSRFLADIPVAMARRGDLVLIGDAIDPLNCPAILTGAEAQSRNETGWVVFPRTLATRAFKVG